MPVLANPPLPANGVRAMASLSPLPHGDSRPTALISTMAFGTPGGSSPVGRDPPEGSIISVWALRCSVLRRDQLGDALCDDGSVVGLSVCTVLFAGGYYLLCNTLVYLMWLSIRVCVAIGCTYLVCRRFLEILI